FATRWIYGVCDTYSIAPSAWGDQPMTATQLIAFTLIAGFCAIWGYLLTGYSRRAFWVAMTLGFLGAYFGPKLVESLSWSLSSSLYFHKLPFPYVASLIGAAVAVFTVALSHRVSHE